jgi:hypothetical protein
MSNQVGIWIDHQKAVIVSASADRAAATTLESNVGPHSRYSGRAGATMPEGGPQDEGGEKRYEKRFGRHLDQYYDEVIRHVGQADALLILGPGEAKLQLKERLRHHKALSTCTVEIETTDKLTDQQIIAKVKAHYGIDR